ncbi:hypothetical protein [Bacillus methanolicus]|uniref:hypothetical protein n=1 Tax=Bacillus methanolicus TaxID=1471 RepID=UPI00025F1D1A|nr:hypothetical protein [Bacillus methanolicus]EIJ82746.1 hypothetical protein MGA3_05935 [Bacillus methanolicus MGA3]
MYTNRTGRMPGFCLDLLKLRLAFEAMGGKYFPAMLPITKLPHHIILAKTRRI